jgi:hypothetical protein
MLIYGHDLDASPSYFDTVKGLLVIYCGEKGESTWVVFHTIGPYSTVHQDIGSLKFTKVQHFSVYAAPTQFGVTD